MPSVSNCHEISSRLPLPLRTAVTTILAPTTAIAILLASPAEVPLSQIRVIEPSPGGTSQRIINKLLLPLRTAVIAVRSTSASATSLIAPACDPLSANLVTTVCAGGESQPINSRFPEAFCTAVRISVSLNACTATSPISPAVPSARGRMNVGSTSDTRNTVTASALSG